MTDKTIHIPKRDRNKSTKTLTLQERGLLHYIEQNLDAAGLFGQRMAITARACLTSRPVIHRTTHSLIVKCHLIVVRESVRGKDGYLSPLFVKPTQTPKHEPSPLADLATAASGVSASSPQTVENMPKSISGHLSVNSYIEGSRSVGQKGFIEGYVDSCPPVDLVPSPLADLAPFSASDSPRIPICNFDNDCTNSPIEGSTFCYRHATRSESVIGGAL